MRRNEDREKEKEPTYEGKMPKIPERKIKMGKVVLKQDSRDRKTKGHHGKAKGQNQKASIHKQAKQIVFLPLPHSTQKIQADFLSKLLHFSRLPPLFHLKPPHHSQIPFHPTRRTRAYAYIRARALSEFTIFAFTLHISPQQADIQHLVRLPLQKNR